MENDPIEEALVEADQICKRLGLGPGQYDEAIKKMMEESDGLRRDAD